MRSREALLRLVEGWVDRLATVKLLDLGRAQAVLEDICEEMVEVVVEEDALER